MHFHKTKVFTLSQLVIDSSSNLCHKLTTS